MSIAEGLLLALCVALVLLPPRYDPAIRWKERSEAAREKAEARTRVKRQLALQGLRLDDDDVIVCTFCGRLPSGVAQNCGQCSISTPGMTLAEYLERMERSE